MQQRHWYFECYAIKNAILVKYFLKCTALKVLQNFEKSSNMAKIKGTPCLPSPKPIFLQITITLKSDFVYPFLFPPLNINVMYATYIHPSYIHCKLVDRFHDGEILTLFRLRNQKHGYVMFAFICSCWPLRPRSCTSELQLKENCSPKVNCRIKFGLARPKIFPTIHFQLQFTCTWFGPY